MTRNPTRAVLPPFESAETSTRETGPTSRGIPAFASGQREAILEMLRAAGPRGVSKEILLYERHFSQAAARIWEIEKLGYQIRHETRPSQKYVTYFLVSEPAQEKRLPTYQPKGPDKRQGAISNSPDWFARETGRERPREPAPDLGPLFTGPIR